MPIGGLWLLAIADSSAPSPTLDIPRGMASGREADFVTIRVSDGLGTVIVDGTGETTHLSSELHLHQLLGLVESYKPDLIFVSLPEEVRRLLGPASALAERVGCPVFEILGSRARRWPKAGSSRLAGLERVVAELSSRRGKVSSRQGFFNG
jgi:hypothetical protein